MADRQFLQALTRRLADEGKLIESGWVAMRLAFVPLDAGKDQLDMMRMAYMSGAQHLFASIMDMLDPGIDETPADLSRMDLIHKELEVFREELVLMARPGGSA